jgi:hypothetical protein
MRPLKIALSSAVVLVALSQPLQAQSNPREGFWWGLGLSYGWVHVRCDICDSDRSWSLSATGRAGGTLSQSVLLGVEANGWTTSEGEAEDQVDEYLGSFSAVIFWYPSDTGSLYFKGGFAYLAYRADDDEVALTSSGFGPQFGIGYEFRVARSFSVQPYFNSIVTIPTGNLDIDGDRQADGVGLSLLQFGLGVTWH